MHWWFGCHLSMGGVGEAQLPHACSCWCLRPVGTRLSARSAPNSCPWATSQTSPLSLQPPAANRTC